jgi:8-oxo-dGTP pyrophosphatase MutT (NUDIX family)
MGDSTPNFNFTSHPSVSSFAVPLKTYISTSASKFKYKYIATGVTVFDSEDRILLLQRAATDSWPHRWETPGGGCDEEDPSILYGAVRELWEEAGLAATSVGPTVGEDQLFITTSGNLVCKFTFLVEAKSDDDGKLQVKLDPNEHQNFLWVSEEAFQTGKVGDLELKFTSEEQKAVVAEAFRVRKRSATISKIGSP